MKVILSQTIFSPSAPRCNRLHAAARTCSAFDIPALFNENAGTPSPIPFKHPLKGEGAQQNDSTGIG